MDNVSFNGNIFDCGIVIKYRNLNTENSNQESTSDELYTLLETEKITEINYEVLSDNPEVVKMLKEKIELEKKIQALDEFALVLLELQILAIE